MHEATGQGRGGQIRTRIMFTSALPVNSGPTSFAWLEHVGDGQGNGRISPGFMPIFNHSTRLEFGFPTFVLKM